MSFLQVLKQAVEKPGLMANGLGHEAKLLVELDGAPGGLARSGTPHLPLNPQKP